MQCVKHVLTTCCRDSGLLETSIFRSYCCSLSMIEKEDAPASDHAERAWAHWNKLGAPKYSVAPMVDQVMQYSAKWVFSLFQKNNMLLLHFSDAV